MGVGPCHSSENLRNFSLELATCRPIVDIEARAVFPYLSLLSFLPSPSIPYSPCRFEKQLHGLEVLCALQRRPEQSVLVLSSMKEPVLSQQFYNLCQVCDIKIINWIYAYIHVYLAFYDNSRVPAIHVWCKKNLLRVEKVLLRRNDLAAVLFWRVMTDATIAAVHSLVLTW